MQKIIRPKIISVISVVAFLRFLVLFALIASPEIKRLGAFYPAIFGAITAAQFISIVGIWHMKKWGVHLFLGCFFLKLMVLILLQDFGVWTWVGVVSSILYCVAFLFYYRQMDNNL